MIEGSDPFLSASFWSYAVLFIIALFTAFFIPGNILTKKLHLPAFQSIVLSFTIGMALWALQGFVLGFLQLRFLTYIYLIICILFWLKQHFQQIPSFRLHFNGKLDWILLILILLGTFSQLTLSLMNGVLFPSGLYYCCSLMDSVFYTAVTNQLITQFPPAEPGVSGFVIHNYHYLTNLVMADISRVFTIPILYLEYPYMSVFISLLIGLSALAFAQTLKLKKQFTYWLLFFLYFSGDLLYLLVMLTKKSLSMPPQFLTNAAGLWNSPSRVFAIVIFFGGLALFVIWTKKKDLYSGILMSLVFATLIGFKVYMGAFVLAGLGTLFLYYIYKRQYRLLIPLITTALISFGIYFPVNPNTGGLVFTGMWRFENFIAQPVYGLSSMELARQIYIQHNNFPHVIINEILYILYYFIFVFGTIILSLLQTKKSLSLLAKPLNIVLISGILFDSFIGFLFIQKTGGANSGEFIDSVVIIASIYAALACYYWLTKLSRPLIIATTIIIVLLTIPRSVQQTIANITYINLHRGLTINNDELHALYYIKDHSTLSSVILSDRQDVCIYISILANRSQFACNDGAPGDRNVPIYKRLHIAETIFTNNNSLLVKQLLENNHIAYLYMAVPNSLPANKNGQLAKLVYQDGTIQVLRIN